MILIKRNIFENNMTLDIDKVTECVLLITRIEILFKFDMFMFDIRLK